MFSRVKIGIFVLFLFFYDLRVQQLLLFLGECASINTDCLLGEFVNFSLVFRLCRGCLLLSLLLRLWDSYWLLVVLGCLKIKVDICLYATDLIIWLTVNNVN
jgi:hypothetical protein